jgi:hypothetical protein
MYSLLNCNNVGKHTEIYLGDLGLNVISIGNAADVRSKSTKVTATCVSRNWYSKCYCVARVTKKLHLKV